MTTAPIHELKIARVIFDAAFRKEDEGATPAKKVVTKELYEILETAINRGSKQDIKSSTQWLLKHVFTKDKECAERRIKPFGRLLELYSTHYVPSGSTENEQDVPGRHLHLLCVISDLMYHLHDCRHWINPTRWNIVEIVKRSASFPRDTHESHHRYLSTLLDHWENAGYFDKVMMENVRIVREIASPLPTSDVAKLKLWALPAIHGHKKMPAFDLPAANFLSHIELTPGGPISRPIRLCNVKPAKFEPDMPSEKLVDAVKEYIATADALYTPQKQVPMFEDPFPDCDGIGQIEEKDGLKSNIYGWSPKFCQKMREVRRARPRLMDRISRKRARSQSQDGAEKRRRLSDTSKSREQPPVRAQSASPVRRRFYDENNWYGECDKLSPRPAPGSRRVSRSAWPSQRPNNRRPRNRPPQHQRHYDRPPPPPQRYQRSNHPRGGDRGYYQERGRGDGRGYRPDHRPDYGIDRPYRRSRWN